MYGTAETQAKFSCWIATQLLDKLKKVTNEHQAQSTALENLTMVLEGFQRTQQNGLKLAEKDFREK